MLADKINVWEIGQRKAIPLPRGMIFPKKARIYVHDRVIVIIPENMNELPEVIAGQVIRLSEFLERDLCGANRNNI